MVQQRIVDSLAQTGGAGDHHHGRFFGVGPGNRVAQAQPPHAIRDAHGAHAVHPSVGVGGESGAIFARAADRHQRAFFQQRIETQDVVPRYSEHVTDAVVRQATNQVLADRQPRHARRAGGESARIGPWGNRVTHITHTSCDLAGANPSSSAEGKRPATRRHDQPSLAPCWAAVGTAPNLANSPPGSRPGYGRRDDGSGLSSLLGGNGNRPSRPADLPFP